MILSTAYAQTSTTPAVTIPSVTIPWGDWASGLLNGLASVLALALTWVVGKYAPALASNFLNGAAITNAVNYGLGAVEGAVAGKTLTVTSTNSVLSAAESYMVAHTPAAAKSLGNMIRPAILAELSSIGVLPPETSAASTGAVVPAKK
jgi:hypothetical protein